MSVPPLLPSDSGARIAAVAIGRNEGERLARCLRSLRGVVGRIVYVDSGSTDGSTALARSLGAEVVELDLSVPFTAARARNAGTAALVAGGAAPDYIQFIDGDCEMREGWIAAAAGFLDRTPEAAAACGRLRERHPEASIYNRMIDREWDTPLGRTRACGGIALIRARALAQAGGFNPRLIAGEEPELCVRLRQAGWEIWRLDHEMAWHDAAMTRFGQWWIRARRAGNAYAEGALMHGRPPERHYVAQLRRALLWGAGLPLATLLALAVTPWGLLLLLVWPAQIARLALRDGDWRHAGFATLGKIPEMLGIVQFHLRRITGRRGRIIEYK